MLKILLTISLSFLLGCGERVPGFVPELKPQTRCSPIIAETIEESYCLCHLYQFDVLGGKVIEAAKRYDLMACNKLIGFPPNNWGKIAVWRDEVILWFRDNAKAVKTFLKSASKKKKKSKTKK